MTDLQALVSLLKRRLSDYGYDEVDPGDAPDGSLHAVIKTQRRWMVRYVCAVAEPPHPIRDLEGALAYFHELRKRLTRKYARFPWYKELGTYSVLICDHTLYEALRGAERRFKDATGLHSNVMLGSVFVNRQSLETKGTSTWGLFHSGRHFGAINAAVSEWAESSLAAQPSR